KVVSLLMSIQHKESYSLEQVRKITKEKVVDPVIKEFGLNNDFNLMINPSGTFIKGGFISDTGLTGRKLMIDTYGVSANHGGGAFSGKDYTKVDRSAAYMARYIAKNLVANEIDSEVEVFISYVIGHSQPFGINVWLTDNGHIRQEVIEYIKNYFYLSPSGIIKTLDLAKPIYKQTATYGHFGRTDLDLPWERVDKKIKL
ncbi:MAG: methionine adenosyltransferase domain-containing protein, partial [Mycoplasmataceae bacterium]|nr:methionine adenosyltransferase domain-containing protein [Mycoplasmataceae bacterium]